MLLAELDEEMVEATLTGPRRATCPGWRRPRHRQDGRVRRLALGPHVADGLRPLALVGDSPLKPAELQEREVFYASHGGIRWVFDHESLRWLFDPRDRSRGAYGMEPEPWLLDWFGGSMEGCWGQYGSPRPMLASVQAPMVWDIREGDLATGSPQWATRPVKVDSWGGEWVVKLSDAPDVFESDDALRAVDGVVIAQPVPVEIPCPACGEHHHPDRGRLDRRSGTWQPCWEMTGALWAILKDRTVTQHSKSWARGFLGLDDPRPQGES